MRATQRLSRRASLVLLSTFLAGPVLGDSTGPLLSVSRLFQAKASYAGPIANKVAEFREDFVVGGLDFSPDGVNLAADAMVEGQDVHVRDWRNKGRLLRVLHKEALSGGGMAIRYSPDGLVLAVGNEAEKSGDRFRLVRVWNTRSWEVIQDLGDTQPASGVITSFAFTPDGKFFVRTADRVGNPGEYMIVHRTDTWDKVWGLPTLPFIPDRLAISPDGLFVALAGIAFEGPQPTKILIVDLSRQTVVRTIEHIFANGTPVETLAWSPDGHLLAVGTRVSDKTSVNREAVRIFDAATGAQQVDERASDAAFVSGLQFSPDGRFLVEGHVDGKVRVWDNQHKRLLQEIPVDESFDPAICISRNSRYLAVGDGKTVSIWEFRQSSSVH